MKTWLQIRFILLVCSGLMAHAAVRAEVRLDDVVGSSEIRERRIAVEGTAPALVRDFEALFRLHGGLILENGRPEFVVTVAAVDEGIQIQIGSGGQALWRGAFAGSGLGAVYQAADVVVERILGSAGWFGSQIAFIATRSGNTEVYLSDLLFRTTRQLTNDRALCLSPAISPKGDALLYTSYHRTGFPDIYRIDLRTNQRTTFAGFKGTNTGAAWSPDGAAVAMVLSGSGNPELFISDPTGRQLQRLTRNESLEADPSWSPDGARLAFTSDQRGGPQLYLINRDGAGMRRLRTDISGNCSEPTWNPVNPDIIAFTTVVGQEFEVAIHNITKPGSTVVSKGAGDAVHPAWLRDGRHLIYTERSSTRQRLVLIDTLTGRRAVLSPAALGDSSQASIAFPR